MDVQTAPRRSAPLGRQRADHATVRRNNLALVLRVLRSEGPRSRARIADETGLNKATVSSLVAELAERGLARDGDVQRRGSVGRPGQPVELDGSSVCGLGLEINVDYVAAMAMDLANDVVFDRRLPVDVPQLGPEASFDRVAELGAQALEAVAARGAVPVGIGLAVPGLVDDGSGLLRVAPNLGWRDVPVVAALAERLPSGAIPVHAENDANLSALAEFILGADAGEPDLVYLTGSVGVGGGVISGGRLLRGTRGASGEVGHLPLNPDPRPCGCGRRGCWETMVGLAGLLDAVAEASDPVRDRSLDLEQRMAEIARRADAGDPRTIQALERIGVGLGVGASVLVNLVNPTVIVLGGYFALLGEYLLEPLERELHARVLAPDAAGARVALSHLGFTAAVRGGAQLALDQVMTDPTLVPLRATAGGAR